MISMPERIASEMKVPISLVENALNFAHIRYKKIQIKKRSGGVRTIIQPSAELKLVQTWLNARVFTKLPLSSAASAFRKGASIVINATVHSGSHYSVRMDIRDFFPSISSYDLVHTILKNTSTLPEYVVTEEFKKLVHTACFDINGRLPIGYSTSPAISNSVMFDIDEALLQRLATDVNKFGASKLTRYADDFVFSSDKRGACRAFISALRETLSESVHPKLSINQSKTKLMSRAGGSTLVTGLRINNTGGVRVHANYRDHIRLLLKLYSTNKLSTEDTPRLAGHLSFIEHADPGLFTRLSFRYFEEISRLRSRT